MKSSMSGSGQKKYGAPKITERGVKTAKKARKGSAMMGKQLAKGPTMTEARARQNTITKANAIAALTSGKAVARKKGAPKPTAKPKAKGRPVTSVTPKITYRKRGM